MAQLLLNFFLWFSRIALSALHNNRPISPLPIDCLFRFPEVNQGSNYLFEVPSWKFILCKPYVRWINIAQHIFPTCRTIYFSVTENIFIWNYRFSGPTSIYLFEFFWDFSLKSFCNIIRLRPKFLHF